MTQENLSHFIDGEMEALKDEEFRSGSVSKSCSFCCTILPLGASQ